MGGWGTSRRSLYAQLDRRALQPLPAEPNEYAEWKRCRVNLDYHVESGKHYYSVPHQLIRQEVEARITVLVDTPAFERHDVCFVELVETLIGERGRRPQLARGERSHRPADRLKVRFDCRIRITNG